MLSFTRALTLGLLMHATSVEALAQTGNAQTAPVMTLDEALALALRANRKLDNAALEVQKATDDLAAARTRQFPSVNLDAFAGYNLLQQEFTVNQGAMGTFPATGPIPATSVALPSQSGFTPLVSASISQPLLQLYRLGLVIDQHGIQQSMAEQGLRGQRHELVKQVKEQYYAILKTQSSLQATNESIVFYRELSKLVARYVREKVALEYQSLETQARLARSMHKARSERNALQTEKERLNRDIETPFSVTVAPELVPRDFDQASAQQTALAQRPDVQEAKLKLQHAQTGYRITQSEYLPDLNLSMRYSRFFNTEFIPEENWTVGLELRWDVFDWGRKRQDLRRKSAGIAQAQNDVLDVESQVRIEVESRIREVAEAREYVKVTQIAQAAAREKLRVLMNQYRQRAVLLTDVLQAESQLADANNEYQHALLSLSTAQAQLDKALGEG
jgi:outer membrane protein TolC